MQNIFGELLANRPDKGPWDLEIPLVAGTTRLPNIDDEIRQAALEYVVG
jgi:hypothetical protein